MRIILSTAIIFAATAAGGEDLKTLWQIGTPDNNTVEFTHAPKDYQAYRRPGFFQAYRLPGFFVVGISDPKSDWPYVQPGPVDGGWAPGEPQTFEIIFGLQTMPSGSCRLLLDFVDTHSVDPPQLRVTVGDRVWESQLPKGGGDGSIFGDASKGREHIMAVDVPAASLKAGDNRVTITTVKGSWVLWDTVRFETPHDVKLASVQPQTLVRSISASPALLWHEGRETQPVSVELMYIGHPAETTVRIGDRETNIQLISGMQTVQAHVPPVMKSTTLKVEIARGDVVIATGEVELKPVRRWELHIVHHTHLDIGFTHTQEEVLKLQVAHLKTALEYIEKTKNYPEASRFIWHPEGMWAIEEFMRTASEDEKEVFIEACRKGQIHLDVLYAQAMTGMYTEEELFELMGAAKRFEKQYGVPIASAMQSDVPGYTWGLAAALAHNGAAYLSVGPNWFGLGGADWYKGAKIVGYTHRGGRVFDWADQPFWWMDPSGQHKVLFWMTGWGYSGFHGYRRGITEDKVFSYLHHLEDKKYPYDMVMWRYSIGGDNGPPDLDLCNSVKDWNEKYACPRLVITQNSKVLQTFADRYGDRIPVVKGDFTPYWEDGSASTSRATSANRRACEKIAQVQNLWAMIAPEQKLHERFDAAWNKMIMYDEHTWGAYNSIGKPDDPFAVQQDRYKQALAFDGLRMTDELLGHVTQSVSISGSHTFDVYNTASWTRDGLILLSRDQSDAGDLVKDDQGRPVPSQRLATGELAFVARKIPALGARRYTIHAGQAHTAGSAQASGLQVSNGMLSLEIDPQSGSIRKFYRQGIADNLVRTDKAGGLNDYLYILGRDANKNRSKVQGPASVAVEDAGPLVATLRIESDAPGCARLIRRVRVADGLDYVELRNTTDKLREQQPEGVYFGFPFNIPNAESRIDVPWAVVQVEKDQIRGANRNFYCVQRWVDLSNDDCGVTWVTVDAPMLQFDPIKIALPSGLEHWREHIIPEDYIHSWVMNNHWETNYKAYQEGPITFRYALRPHANGHNAVAAQRFGRDICQPLLAVPADPSKPVIRPLMQVSGDNIVVTSVKPSRDAQALMVRLFAASDKPGRFTLNWREPKVVCLSDTQESRGMKVDGPIDLPAYGIVTVRVEDN